MIEQATQEQGPTASNYPNIKSLNLTLHRLRGTDEAGSKHYPEEEEDIPPSSSDESSRNIVDGRDRQQKITIGVFVMFLRPKELEERSFKSTIAPRTPSLASPTV